MVLGDNIAYWIPDWPLQH